MSAELASLCVGSVFSRRKRQELVGVGRSIRNAHFQAEDSFRCIKMSEIVSLLGGKGCAVQMPPVACLYGNTIGGIVPYFYIGALAAARRPKTVFEIGTYLGASALTLALNTDPDCRILTVDLPDEDTKSATLSAGDQALVSNAMQRVGAAFSQHELASRITQIRADSATMNISEYLAGRTVDLFFIDGGHSYDCVSHDTQAAFNCLSIDGLVVWDDYNWIFPELRRFLQEVAKSRPLARIEGTQFVISHPSLA